MAMIRIHCQCWTYLLHRSTCFTYTTQRSLHLSQLISGRFPISRDEQLLPPQISETPSEAIPSNSLTDVLLGTASGKKSRQRLKTKRIHQSPQVSVKTTPKPEKPTLNSKDFTDEKYLGEKIETFTKRNGAEWAEVFGIISDKWSEIQKVESEQREDQEEIIYKGDEGEADEEPRPLRPRGKHTPAWYSRKIKALCKDDQVFEAVEVLEKRMLVDDRVKPDVYNYTTVISALARVGYLRKAVSLFNKMKKRGLTPDGRIYTSLFNACANSPYKQSALKQADHLRLLMTRKSITPHPTTYRAMIKAYGMLGELQTAFALLDEGLQQGDLQVSTRVFNHLLIACISDKDAGFKHAIEVWRKMMIGRVRPDVSTYNLLLRAAYECGVGDVVFSQQLLSWNGQEHLKQQETKMRRRKQTAKRILELNTGDSSEDRDRLKEKMEMIESHGPENFPVAPSLPSDHAHAGPTNLLAPGGFNHVQALGDVSSPENRLALIGGINSVLQQMHDNALTPDIKTYTLLLKSTAQTVDAENNVVEMIRQHGKMMKSTRQEKRSRVELDATFYNTLIHKRCSRGEFQQATDVLSMMTTDGIKPDLYTFTSLATGCTKMKDGLQLLEDMENLQIPITILVYNTLLHVSSLNFYYKLHLCEHIKEYGITPDHATVEIIERQITKAQTLITKQEKGLSVPNILNSPKYKNQFGQFMNFYTPWLKVSDVADPDDPMAKYKQPRPDPTPQYETPDLIEELDHDKERFEKLSPDMDIFIANKD